MGEVGSRESILAAVWNPGLLAWRWNHQQRMGAASGM